MLNSFIFICPINNTLKIRVFLPFQENKLFCVHLKLKENLLKYLNFIQI